MSLVAYSDSDNEAEQQTAATVDSQTSSRTKLPSLPSNFHNLYASNVRTSICDDPAQHDGRIRQTPHVDGEWPTHCYIEWSPEPCESRSIRQLVEREREHTSDQKTVHSLLESDLGAIRPLHISLSHTLPLLTQQRHAFLQQCQDAIYALKLQPFNVTISNFSKWAANDTFTRWFLVLPIDESEAGDLRKVFAAVSAVVSAFGFPVIGGKISASTGKRGSSRACMDMSDLVTPNHVEMSRCNDGNELYKLHVSIAWALHDPQRCHALYGTSCELHTINIREVKLRIGNEVHAIRLHAEQ